jgi:hypothetical protein
MWAWFKYRRLVRSMAAFQAWLQVMPATEMAVWCVVLALVLLLPFAPLFWRMFERGRALRNPQRAPRTSASFWYLRLLKKLARGGLRKEPTQTPEEFAATITDPATRHEVFTFTQHYERARFAESVEDAKLLPSLYEGIAAKK